MFLQGYGPLILSGTWQTVKLAVLSLVFAFVIGLLGAAAKLSRNRVSSGVGTIYTTLVRGVPDLVLMLLLFYSIQIWLNHLTDFLGWDQIDIDPFIAGVVVQGFFGATLPDMASAYLTERFPTEVRSTAIGFCYHVGAIFGSLVPPAISYFAVEQEMGFGVPMLIGTVAGAVSVVLALLISPETKGKVFVAELMKL